VNTLPKQRTESTVRSRKFRLVAAVGLTVVVIALLAWQSDLAHLLVSKFTPIGSNTGDKFVLSKEAKLNLSETLASQSNGINVMTAKSPTNIKGNEDSAIAEIFKGSAPEICGLTKEEAKAFIASNGNTGARSANLVLNEKISKFVQSGNLREKAIGLYLFAHQAGQAAMDSESVNYLGCKKSPECFNKPYEAMLQARPVNAEPLVKLALGSNDLDVYATALYGCTGVKTNVCASLTYQNWAEMEPNNAAAWLMAANEAESRKDSVARAAALRHAVTAKDYNTRTPSLATVLTAESAKELSPLAQSSIAGVLMEIDESIKFKPLGGVGRHCGAAEVIDDERRVLCDALATKLADNDKTLVGVRMAITIGERLGWSNERLQPLKDEYLVGTSPTPGSLDQTMFTCNTLYKANQAVQKSLSVGERAAVHDVVKKSGKSLAELASDYRLTSSIK
jgi:hypothetical protein